MTPAKLPFVTVSVVFVLAGPAAARGLALAYVEPTDFFSIAPCRAIDTRLPDSPLGGPALVAGVDRVFPLSGVCGIPAEATAVSVNIAVAGGTMAGNLRLHPGGTAVPLVSAINYSAGQIRSNNAVAPLNTAGELAAFAGAASGTVHLILDVNGYFAPATASTGTDFSLTLPDHLCVSLPGLCPPDAPSAKLRIAARTSTSGQVTFSGQILPFTVASGGEAVVALPIAAVLTSNEAVETKGIHVTAAAPISVQAIVETPDVADGYLALPTAHLGAEYLIMSRSDPAIAGSVLAIAGAHNGTTVTITPTAAGATRPAGVPFSVSLDAGQTYQFENPGFADLTGTQVSADKPIAVFSGHKCARIPTTVSYCDSLAEQLPDISRLGKEHHLAPFSGRSRYTVRVLGALDNTTLAYNPPLPGAPTTLNRGQFFEFFATAGLQLVSDKPILVAQFMHGSTDDLSTGDPSMVIVTPAEQGLKRATFSAHGLTGTAGASFLNLVTPTSALSSLVLDGVPVNPAPFVAIGTSGFSAAAIAITAGAHTLQGSAPFTAVVYGYGASSAKPVSYIYPAPRSLAVLPP